MAAQFPPAASQSLFAFKSHGIERFPFGSTRNFSFIVIAVHTAVKLEGAVLNTRLSVILRSHFAEAATAEDDTYQATLEFGFTHHPMAVAAEEYSLQNVLSTLFPE